jgi:hypothetical protein
MSHLLPTLTDLGHVLLWVWAVTVIAVLLGAFFAIVDTIVTYGLPNFTAAIADDVKIRVKLPQSLSGKAAKGFRSPSPHVVDIATGRRRQAAR